VTAKVSSCRKQNARWSNLLVRLRAAAGGIDVRQFKFGFGEAPVKPILTLSTTCVLLVLPAFASANSPVSNVAQPSIRAFSYSGHQVQSLGVEPEFGAMDPADLSATTEDFGDGIYHRFADQIETLLAPIGPVDPTSDRMSWAILVIAFAGLTAAASSWRRARSAKILI
jgi:hypothetical protein